MMYSIQKTIIVSPSGNFYGSEQVLYNHLEHTTKQYTVFVPAKSAFSKKLIQQNKHRIYAFTNLKLLYFKVLFRLLFNSFNTLYINEGGHIKYAKLIARFFPSSKVIVHIRLLEDATPSRLGKLPDKLKLISISTYIQELLRPSYASIQIYDPLDASNVPIHSNILHKEHIKIGIIGRVSLSKGLQNYDKLFTYYFSLPDIKNIHFIFFGDVMDKEKEVSLFFDKYSGSGFPNIEFRGFVKDQEQIFSSIDTVLHLNEKEPLGRIGLESWARGIPFLCFNSGGCGEINQLLEMEKFSVEYDTLWEAKVIDLISNIETVSSEYQEKARANLKTHFSLNRYVEKLEKEF